MTIRRAREFVLNDKCRAIQKEVNRICGRYWDASDEENIDSVAREIMVQIEKHFDLKIYLDSPEFHEQLVGAIEPSGFETVGTLVAKKLLDHDSPKTRSDWTERWGRGFGCLDLEQKREQKAKAGQT
jgi:hypothetical protein